MTAPITATHTYGWKKEVELKGRLEELLGEEITKHDERFHTWDYYTDDYEIELKSRTDKYTEHSFGTWQVPECKTKGLSKELIIFYHFGSTNSLFYIIYEEDLFKTYDVIINKGGQRTIEIPAKHFTKVTS
jgi:hypothetical protein